MLTIRLDDFIIEKKLENVKKIVEDFIDINPDYDIFRNKIYHIACQIMETHKDELWEKTLNIRLKKFLAKSDKNHVKEIIEKFVKKYPEYKKDPGRVYHVAAKMMDTSNEQHKKNLLRLK